MTTPPGGGRDAAVRGGCTWDGPMEKREAAGRRRAAGTSPEEESDAGCDRDTDNKDRRKLWRTGDEKAAVGENLKISQRTMNYPAPKLHHGMLPSGT